MPPCPVPPGSDFRVASPGAPSEEGTPIPLAAETLLPAGGQPAQRGEGTVPGLWHLEMCRARRIFLFLLFFLAWFNLILSLVAALRGTFGSSDVGYSVCFSEKLPRLRVQTETAAFCLFARLPSSGLWEHKGANLHFCQDAQSQIRPPLYLMRALRLIRGK